MPFDKLDFKMHLLKQAIKWILPKIKRFSGHVSPVTPHSRLINRVFDRLDDVLAKEVQTGCFDDRNFRELLKTIRQALVFLCEKDRYYMRWLGILVLFMSEELEILEKEFTLEDAKKCCARPMFITPEEFDKHRRSLLELWLTGYLYGMSLLKPEEIAKIEKARVEHKDVTLPSQDHSAYFKLFFPEKEQFIDKEKGKE